MRSRGGLWEVFKQHLPCLKRPAQRCFQPFKGGVEVFTRQTYASSRATIQRGKTKVSRHNIIISPTNFLKLSTVNLNTISETPKELKKK